MSEAENLDPEGVSSEDAIVNTEDETGQTAEEIEGQTAAEDKGTVQPDPESEPDETPEVSPAKKRRDRAKAHLKKKEDELAQLTATQDRIKRAAAGIAEPAEDKFEDYEDYRIAKALWNNKQAEIEAQSQEVGQQIETTQAEAKAHVAEQWQDQVSDAKAKYEDFDKVALDPRLAVSDAMVDVLSQSDAGADVLYFLGSNPDVSERIARLPPVQAAMEIGRIEATLTVPMPKTQSSALPPITPVEGEGSVTQKSPQDMNTSEYREWRQSGGTF